jgi:RimJ/RimL family protein N-acetyltransferase
MAQDPRRGERVFLRPMTPADADELELEDTPELNEFNWFSAREPGLFRRRVEENPGFREEGGRFAVAVETGRLVGEISWRRLTSSPTPASFRFNLGVYLLADERGKGYGTEAQRLLADYLFATTLAERVEATTDVDNRAEQRALEKAGFTREGVLRGYQYRLGAWHDMVIFSRLRGDS